MRTTRRRVAVVRAASVTLTTNVNSSGRGRCARETAGGGEPQAGGHGARRARPAVGRLAAAGDEPGREGLALLPAGHGGRRDLQLRDGDRFGDDPDLHQCPVQQRRHRACALPAEMQAVGLEPVGVAARVEVPVCDGHLGVASRRRPDHVVHREVRLPLGAQRHPDHALHAEVAHRGERVLDVAGVRLLEVVVSDRDDHGAAGELRPERAEQVEHGRRGRVLVGAARLSHAAAGSNLQVDVGAATQRRLRHLLVRDRTGHRVPDHRHLRERGRGSGPRGGKNDPRKDEGGSDREGPPPACRTATHPSMVLACAPPANG